MARTVTCACGVTFTGPDDEDLFRQARLHAADAHTDLNMSDDQIRGMITASAKDA